MLHDKMIKLMAKKKESGSTLSPEAMQAKSGVLQHLMSEIAGGAKDKLGGLKKVTVASNDPKGLEAGLEKAKAMVGGESPEDIEDPDHDGDNDLNPEEDTDHDAGGMTPESIDEEIQKLLALKAQLESHKA